MYICQKRKTLKTNTLILFTCLFTNYLFGQCDTFPVLEIGNDTTLCQGTSITYNLPPGYDTYEWSTGTIGTSITVNSPTTIWLQVGNVSPNLVTNGDFEAGNTGFSSAYIYGTGGTYGLLSSEGQYAIATSPNATHINFSNCIDHTPTGVGNMLVANGSGVPNTSVWCQTITVDPNTDYLFSAWFMNALNDPNVSNLQFYVNDIQIGSVFSTSPTGCIWAEFNEIWNSGSSTTADLCIRNQNTSTGGNDFAIDDITFRAVCVQYDSIIVSYDPLAISIASDLTFCENESESLTVTSTIPGTTFTWEDGSTGSTFTPTTSGNYSVSSISTQGCVVSDSANVTIVPMPWAIDSIETGPTNCGTQNGYVVVYTNGTFLDPPVYTWSGPGAGSSNQINASVWTDLPVGWYYLSIESNGCYLYDSTEVISLNPPVANFTSSIYEGCSPLEVTFTNNSQSATSYTWIFGNGNSQTTATSDAQTQVYSSNATVFLIANQNTCSDTFSLDLIVNTCGCTDPTALNFNPLANVSDGSCTYPFPTVEVFNVITPDGNGQNDEFFVKATNATEITLKIVNRWGNVILDQVGLNPIWDGKVNGQVASEGVYFYTYSVKGINNETIEGHGFVELIK